MCSIWSATRGCCGRFFPKHVSQTKTNTPVVLIFSALYLCLFVRLWSIPLRFFTELPGPPTNMAISNIGPRSVTLQFKPGYDGKTSISRWQVEAQVSSEVPILIMSFLLLESSALWCWQKYDLICRFAVQAQCCNIYWFMISVASISGWCGRRKWGLGDGPPGVQWTWGPLLRGARSQPIHLLQVASCLLHHVCLRLSVVGMWI